MCYRLPYDESMAEIFFQGMPKVERRSIVHERFGWGTVTSLMDRLDENRLAVPERPEPGSVASIHFLGLSDNVSYFVEQLETADVSEYRYRVVFRPSVILPDIDAEVGTG